MTINVRGYAAPTAKTALAPYQFTRRDIRSDDIVIKISTVEYAIQICIPSTMTGVGACSQ